MFDDVQEPKDMFADVPDAGAVPKPASAAPVTPLVSQPSAQVISPAQAMQYDAPKSGGSGFRLVAVVILSLVCVGGAGYGAYRFMVRDAVSQRVSDVIDGTSSTTTPESNTSTNGSSTQNTSPTTNTSASGNETDTGPTAVVDSDGDGLSNDEERIAGTSVAKPDTDGDGLGDREEVKVYGTDPKKVDTDGDGYNDGDEVKNGYNPNGEGRLLQLPQ